MKWVDREYEKAGKINPIGGFAVAVVLTLVATGLAGAIVGPFAIIVFFVVGYYTLKHFVLQP